MAYTYKRADISDLEQLVDTRIKVLRAANRLADDVKMDEVRKESEVYYKESLGDDSHTAFLVFDNDTWIGAGGISYYKVMPTYHNPGGKKAYIMNIYTDPDYRRQGIARKLLDLLLQDAREKEILEITLEATEMGWPLYESYGFVPMEQEMQLPIFN